MAMFARRVLQTMLDHLAVHLPREARKKLAHELNRQSSSALGFEWETALLFGLSHIGKIDYEVPSSQGSRPDVTFVESSEAPISFTADIATVSDDGLEDENPATRLFTALIRLKQKYELPGSTHITIKGHAVGPHYRDRKMRLKLPPGPEVEKMLKKHVAPVFKRVRDEKLPTANITINEPGVELTISYDASQRNGGGSYPSYTAAYSLTRNPVYTSLKGKIRQLKKSESTGARGILLCDGGCELLKNTHSHGEAANVGQVVNEFFRQNSSVAFVVILIVPPTSSISFAEVVKKLRIAADLYINPRAKKALDSTALLALVNRALSYLSLPSATPQDALHWITHADAHEGTPIHTLTEGGSMIRISARKIQELLAGRMTPDQFFSDYSRPNLPLQNPFAKMLKQGLTIQSVNLTRVPEADDDVLEFRFGPDAAIQKFVAGKECKRPPGAILAARGARLVMVGHG
jgi:hypothetical protein